MHSIYDGSMASDRVIILYVFLPIIRREITSFVRIWNSHRIRRDNTRPDQVPGRPIELFQGYTDRQGVLAQDYSRPVDPEAVEALLRVYDVYSKWWSIHFAKKDWIRNNFGSHSGCAREAFCVAYHATTSIDSDHQPNNILMRVTDLDSFITIDSERWLSDAMYHLAHPEPPQAFEFLTQWPTPRHNFPQWLIHLFQEGRNYVISGGRLDITRPPTGTYDWFAHQIIENERLWATNTQGHEQNWVDEAIFGNTHTAESVFNTGEDNEALDFSDGDEE
jgi:hypothetical protein